MEIVDIGRSGSLLILVANLCNLFLAKPLDDTTVQKQIVLA